MKTLLKLVIIFLVPLQTYSQEITGVWSGTIYNDTTQKFIPYQIAISENKGRLSGFSHTIFITGDKKETGVKSIKINRNSLQIFIEDYKLIFNNYDAPPPKGVRQFSALLLSENDSLFILSGTFTTNRTRDYIPLTGTVYLTKQKDFMKTEIAQKLAELELLSSLSFTREQIKKENLIATVEKKEPGRAKIVKPTEEENPVVENKTVIKQKQKINTPPLSTEIKNNKTSDSTLQARLVNTSVEKEKRKIETIKTVFVKSDSVTITLYDNGEVDGDIVSIIMNGEVIMANQKLSARPITKTIYITPQMGETIQIIMYAENLGSIPPNTGLLILQDGSERHEIRFAGDLQKNSAIILKRK